MKYEDKTYFDELDEQLDVCSIDIAYHSKAMKSQNVSRTYRTKTKREIYELLAIGTYIKKNKISIEQLVKSVGLIIDVREECDG